MGWALRYIEQLKAGETISFRPRGNSMAGKIDSGQLVTVEPLKAPPTPGDIVLCKVNGREYLHLVRALNGRQAQIANNRGHINGWTSFDHVYGVVTRIQA